MSSSSEPNEPVVINIVTVPLFRDKINPENNAYPDEDYCPHCDFLKEYDFDLTCRNCGFCYECMEMHDESTRYRDDCEFYPDRDCNVCGRFEWDCACELDRADEE